MRDLVVVGSNEHVARCAQAVKVMDAWHSLHGPSGPPEPWSLVQWGIEGDGHTWYERGGRAAAQLHVARHVRDFILGSVGSIFMDTVLSGENHSRSVRIGLHGVGNGQNGEITGFHIMLYPEPLPPDSDSEDSLAVDWAEDADNEQDALDARNAKCPRV